MFYFDETRTIKEQIKDVKLSVPKLLLILLADIILITLGGFLSIIGAKVLGTAIIMLTLITSLLIPVGKPKSEPIVWTVHKND